MAMSSLWCFGRPEVEGFTYLDQPSCTRDFDQEKKLDTGGGDDDDDDMSQRLSDLRREISDAKIDW